MSKGKGLGEIPKGCEPYESKLNGVHKTTVHGDKGKMYHSKHQNNQNDDPSNIKEESIHSAHGLNRAAIFEAACRDKGLSTQDIIQGLLGLNETKTEILKSIVNNLICQYNGFQGFISNIATEFRASGGNTHTSGRYGNNMLTNVQGVDNGNANNDFFQAFIDIAHAAVGEKNQKDSLRYLPCEYFSVATNGEGDNDPGHAKPEVDFGGSGFPARWLIRLETKSSNEIHTEVLTKEDCSVDFAKSISGKLDKLSWREKCEEVCCIISMHIVCFILLTFRTVLVSIHLKVNQQ